MKLRQPKPANVCLPPGSATAKPRLLVRSRASPTRHPTSLLGRARLWALSNGLPCPQRSGSRSRLGEFGLAEAAKGSAPPPPPLFEPHRPHARSSAAGLLPGARRTRDIPTEFRATSARRRQFGRGCRPSRAFANPALRAASRAYRQTSRARGLASAADRGNPGKGPAASQGSAEAFAGTEDSRRQITASMPHASGPTDRRPRPHLSKRPRKRPWDGQLSRERKCTKRNCGAGEAPQERRRGCTRTPRKRRRSGWMRP